MPMHHQMLGYRQRGDAGSSPVRAGMDLVPHARQKVIVGLVAQWFARALHQRQPAEWQDCGES